MRTHRWLGVSFTITTGLLIGLAGCKDENKVDKPAAKVERPKDGKPVEGQTVANTKVPELFDFEKAVLIDPAPLGELRPPDMTVNGKKPANIFQAISSDLWAKVNFKDDKGRRINYRAVFTTDVGEFQIELYGDIAPNHVRSFVSLCLAGYYDGMKFYFTYNDDEKGAPVKYVETGCPKGTGEDGYGSVGYWLRPEFSDKVTHEAGTVGACLRETDDTGACRFYITTVPLPGMDGKFTAFGKVTQGLDVVRAINSRPAKMDRPLEPVTIRGVRIDMVKD